MIKKKIIVLYIQEIGETIHTQKQRKKADKIKTCILYQAKPKQPPKQEKTL